MESPVAVRRVDAGAPDVPSDVVVSLVAETSERDVRELPRLSGVVNPDAIDALFRRDVAGPAGEGSLTFTYAGYRVVVDHRGTVALYPDA